MGGEGRDERLHGPEDSSLRGVELRPPCQGEPSGPLRQDTARHRPAHRRAHVRPCADPQRSVPLTVETLVVLGAAPAEQMSDVRPQAVMRSADRWSEATGVAPAPLLATQVDVPFDLLSS